MLFSVTFDNYFNEYVNIINEKKCQVCIHMPNKISKIWYTFLTIFQTDHYAWNIHLLKETTKFLYVLDFFYWYNFSLRGNWVNFRLLSIHVEFFKHTPLFRSAIIMDLFNKWNILKFIKISYFQILILLE